MKSVIYNTIDNKLMKEWQLLWEKSAFANYVNSPFWFQSVIETFGYKEYAIIAIYDKEKLIGTGAIVKKKKYGVDFYTIAPEDFVCGTPFLIDVTNPSIVADLTKQLLTLGNIFLTNIPEEFLNEMKKHTEKINAVRQAPNYYLPIVKDAGGLAHLNKKNKLMHQVKNIAEKFTFRTFEGTSSAGLDKVFALDERSSKQGKGYNAFDSDFMKEFYEILAKHFKKHLLANIMYFEGKPIAYEIGFLINNTYFGSQTAYDIEYKHFSPGKVIFVKLADFLASKNVKMWDLGSGESSVKQLVTDEKRELYQVTLTQSAFIRNYSKKIEKLKINIFKQTHRHAKLYSVYRKTKKLTSK